MKKIILGAGCYWCIEALFKELKGIYNLKSGYYSLKDTTYALNEKDKIEVVSFEYEEQIISFESLLNFFFGIHNPSLVSWEEDSFYPAARSVIFYFDEEQFNKSNLILNNLKEENIYNSQIHTKILKANSNKFTLSEEKYIDYYGKYPSDPYSTSNIIPKLNLIQEKFPELLK